MIFFSELEFSQTHIYKYFVRNRIPILRAINLGHYGKVDQGHGEEAESHYLVLPKYM